MALLVVLEALATAAVGRLGEPAVTRMREWDALASTLPPG